MDVTRESKPLENNAAKRPKKPRRRKWLIGSTLLAFLVLLAAPTLLRIPWFRDRFMRSLAREIQGTLSAEEIRAGWWTPPHVHGIALRAPDDSPVLEISELSGPRGVAGLLWHRDDLGTWILEQPRIRILCRADESLNLFDAFKRVEGARGTSFKAWLRWLQRRQGELEIHGGTLSFQRAAEGEPWRLGELDTTLHTVPAVGESPATLSVQPGRLVDHVAVTPEVSNDLLKFFAPILAQATRMEGTFSIDSEALETSWEDWLDIRGKGTLHLHRVQIGPGPLVAELIDALGLEGTVRLVDECPVAYQILDRGVEHTGLKFQIGRVALISSGRVEFDEAIKLKIAVRLPDEPARDGPLARALAGKEIVVPLRGTLRRPRLDAKELVRENRGNLGDWLDEASLGVEKVESLLRQWSERRARRADESSQASDETPPAPPLRDRLRNRLGIRLKQFQEALQAEENSEPEPLPDSNAPSDAEGAP